LENCTRELWDSLLGISIFYYFKFPIVELRGSFLLSNKPIQVCIGEIQVYINGPTRNPIKKFVVIILLKKNIIYIYSLFKCKEDVYVSI
jgi:hypothetical protein